MFRYPDVGDSSGDPWGTGDLPSSYKYMVRAVDVASNVGPGGVSIQVDLPGLQEDPPGDEPPPEQDPTYTFRIQNTTNADREFVITKDGQEYLRQILVKTLNNATPVPVTVPPLPVGIYTIAASRVSGELQTQALVRSTCQRQRWASRNSGVPLGHEELPVQHMRPLKRPRTSIGETRTEEQGGLSLIELLVAMSILIVAMGAIYGIWLGLGRTYAYTQDDIVAQQQAQAALGEMVEYIRTVRMPPAEELDEEFRKPIVSADANSIEVWTDTDRDPGHELERVTFRVDVETGILYRDDVNTGSVRLVTGNVANDDVKHLFTYFDFNGDELILPWTTHGPFEKCTSILELTSTRAAAR